DGGALQAGGSFTVANAIKINPGGGAIDAATHAFSITGNIADGTGAPGALTIISTGGPGSVLFFGNNAYSAQTIVAAGANRAAGASTALSPNSDFTVDGAITLLGNNNTIRSLSGSGGVANFAVTPATLTIAPPSGTFTFSGVIKDGLAGALALVK